MYNMKMDKLDEITILFYISDKLEFSIAKKNKKNLFSTKNGKTCCLSSRYIVIYMVAAVTQIYSICTNYYMVCIIKKTLN